MSSNIIFSKTLYQLYVIILVYNVAILVIILALIFACIEIEIEGPCGWADKLPTPSTGSNQNH